MADYIITFTIPEAKVANVVTALLAEFPMPAGWNQGTEAWILHSLKGLLLSVYNHGVDEAAAAATERYDDIFSD